jgi:hypothetical protein
LELLHRQPDARILICTQSNSAADLYVTRFFLTLSPEERYKYFPFRIYYVGRRIASIDPSIRQVSLARNWENAD